MPLPLITDYYFSFSTGSLFICSLDVKEGLTFLAEFDNEEALSEFSELCSKEDNVLIIHSSDDIVITVMKATLMTTIKTLEYKEK